MSDTAIFAVGISTFLLLGGGLAVTVYEMRRLYETGAKKK